MSGHPLICPWCRYDIDGLEPDDGTITCPECGRTCTLLEAHSAARAIAMRPGAFTREAIIGGSVGMLIGAMGAVLAWRSGTPSPLIYTLVLAVWFGSLTLGAAGVSVAARRTRERGSAVWVLVAVSAVLGWIALVHAVAAVLVVLVVAA
ncbi:MAG: hypothetical protein DHS20C14_22040 [Phycisphaeraceae bacterium]|nr:MAG: hypothetical protein DHS20C14_22040 [Phycisphaeraceae bacterium]